MSTQRRQLRNKRLRGLLLGGEVRCKLVTFLEPVDDRTLGAAIVDVAAGGQSTLVTLPVVKAGEFDDQADLAAKIVNMLDGIELEAIADLARMLWAAGILAACTMQAAAAFLVLAVLPRMLDELSEALAADNSGVTHNGAS